MSYIGACFFDTLLGLLNITSEMFGTMLSSVRGDVLFQLSNPLRGKIV
jgi:hypothetical protein